MVASVAREKPSRGKRGVFDGAKLREHRLAQDLTQAALAKKAGIHVLDVSRYERDEVEPSLGVAVKLADLLGVDVKKLLKGE
jgi:transcriptional regulator with XRE-family HTH domain